MRTAAGRRRAGLPEAGRMSCPSPPGVSVRRARTWAKTVAGAKRQSADAFAFMRCFLILRLLLRLGSRRPLALVPSRKKRPPKPRRTKVRPRALLFRKVRRARETRHG